MRKDVASCFLLQQSSGHLSAEKSTEIKLLQQTTISFYIILHLIWGERFLLRCKETMIHNYTLYFLKCETNYKKKPVLN